MANRTVKDAQSVHGTNPQYLVEKIIRTRIYDSKYWKESCFALTAELLVDKAMELRSIGGVYGGNIKPTPFLCLTLKMLQIQPEKDIIIEFIKQDDFKYVRALGAYYLRLVHTSQDCYKYLEPLFNDYRKLRFMNRNGQYELSHMDEFIDVLMREERVCDIMLPRIQKRWVHEANNELEARVSLLDDDLDDLESESEDEDLPPSPPITPPKRIDENSRSIRDDRASRRSPLRNDVRFEREKRHRSRSRDRERTKRSDPDRKRRRSRSKDRRRDSSPSHHHKHRDHERSNRDKGRSHESKRSHNHHRDRKDKHDRERRKHHKREFRDEGNSEDLEIAEANALRAKLGMPPLRRQTSSVNKK